MITELEFRQKWALEKPLYEAWGTFVQNKILEGIKQENKEIEEFLKVPAKIRLKTDASLIDKAFNRPEKNYTNPYDDIEDKVGIRFVVLLLEDIKLICDFIENSQSFWCFDACKHFNEDKDKNPLLFTYQSVHYILRPTVEFDFQGVTIPTNIACEVQVRTLLQHAHAELTHDAIYKSKTTIKPIVHRTVAKCMALIETTDDFFSAVTQELNNGALENFSIIHMLDLMYFDLTGVKSQPLKSSIAIWDSFESFITENLISDIKKTLQNNTQLKNTIETKLIDNVFYRQSTILFVYWMLDRNKVRLLNDWPLPRNILEMLAADLGISLNQN
jgi:ppGpp synthetase/RelA/SpoT-type nucleotidyltranferase